MLNERQEMFVSEYQTDKSPMQAALRAGYAPRTARQAHRWLRPGDALFRPEMARRANQTLTPVAQPEEVLASLTSILRREVMERVVVTSSEKRPVTLEDGKTRYEERRESSVVDVPPKLSDVIRAAELLGRQHGLWSERAVDMSDLVRIIDDVRDLMEDSVDNASSGDISLCCSLDETTPADPADFSADETFVSVDALEDFPSSDGGAETRTSCATAATDSESASDLPF